ncbi:hypothetical protein AVEN_129996-1 [Araneus ventricosus]|uniref:Uncharacterized protein n=1 Tax=Araneus ventricosus TaxID=182803 RepID=A0A4Y2EKX0_ARAVE|nr:hypothetical protein AVEN_129996-1 [Araneus ventricosus]
MRTIPSGHAFPDLDPVRESIDGEHGALWVRRTLFWTENQRKNSIIQHQSPGAGVALGTREGAETLLPDRRSLTCISNSMKSKQSFFSTCSSHMKGVQIIKHVYGIFLAPSPCQQM